MEDAPNVAEVQSNGTTTSRREALVSLAVCGCCMAGASSVVAAPEDRVPPPTTQGRSDLGPLSDFAADGVYDKFARTGQVMLIRKAGTLYVTSSICSHKRCVLKKKDDGLLCPCHQSQFNSDGIPLDGPAKTPLTRYGISLENNRVMVDTTKSFAEKEWAAEGALVKLPA